MPEFAGKDWFRTKLIKPYLTVIKGVRKLRKQEVNLDLTTTNLTTSGFIYFDTVTGVLEFNKRLIAISVRSPRILNKNVLVQILPGTVTVPAPIAWKVLYVTLSENELNALNTISVPASRVLVASYDSYVSSTNNIVIASVQGDTPVRMVSSGKHIEDISAMKDSFSKMIPCGFTGMTYSKETRALTLNRIIWMYKPHSGINSYYFDLYITTPVVLPQWSVAYIRMSPAQTQAGTVHFVDSDVIVEPYNTYSRRWYDLVVAVSNGATGVVYFPDGSNTDTVAHISKVATHITEQERASIETLPKESFTSTLLKEFDRVVPYNSPQSAYPPEWVLMNGEPEENSIYLETDGSKTPSGKPTYIYECKASQLGGAAGGHRSAKVKVDPTKKYRFSAYIWIDTFPSDGSFYLGTYQYRNNTNSNVPMERSFLPVGDSGETNYYTWYGDVPTANAWHLVVGYIYPYQTPQNATTDGGVYSMATKLKVANGTGDARFKYNDITDLAIRFYSYYAEAVGIKKRFSNIRLELMDGSETPLETLLRQPKAYIEVAKGSAKEGAIYYDPVTKKHSGFNGSSWSNFN